MVAAVTDTEHSRVDIDDDAAIIDLSRIRDLIKDGYPLYRQVPKGLLENLAYRKKLIRWGSKSKANAKTLYTACSRDLLFYVNTFVWTYDNRKLSTPRLPFITYPFQDEAFAALEEAIGQHDVLIDKSRDMGASWICVAVLEWLWHFRPFLSFLFVSRKEHFVDKSGDPKSLFWKLDFIHENLPGWLMPAVHRIKLHKKNLDNGSTIDGESTNEDVARGDRRTAILLDEFASVKEGHQVDAATLSATNTRILNSTPKGIGNAFYDLRQSGTPRLTLHWTQHPEKGRYSE